MPILPRTKNTKQVDSHNTGSIRDGGMINAIKNRVYYMTRYFNYSPMKTKLVYDYQLNSFE